MIDVSLKGIRCRAAQEILDIDGTVEASTEGTAGLAFVEATGVER